MSDGNAIKKLLARIYSLGGGMLGVACAFFFPFFPPLPLSLSFFSPPCYDKSIGINGDMLGRIHAHVDTAMPNFRHFI